MTRRRVCEPDSAVLRNRKRPLWFAAVSTTLLVCVLPVTVAGAQEEAAPVPITLDQALARARLANAHLPVSAFNVAIARAQLREARARLKPQAFFDSDIHSGSPLNYSGGDARFQVVGVDTLFDGGRLRANVRINEQMTRGAQAGYRVTIKDVELNVLVAFTDGLRAQQEIAIRQAGLPRLRAYLTLLEAQQAAGQGVAGDVLRTRSRLADEEANIADAERLLDEAQLELNDLMGEPPRATLAFAPLPAPAPPTGLLAAETTTPWLLAPDVQQAEAGTEAARAAIAVARADRKPQLSVTADVGVLPTFAGQPGTGLNTGHGAGGEVTFWLTLPFFDFGIYRSRLEQAQLAASQAADSARVVRRQSELEWSRAEEQLRDYYQIITLRSRSVPLARDAYLETESLFRGGRATSLEVLDAYTAWVDAQVGQVEAEMNYRQAEARLARWGSP